MRQSVSLYLGASALLIVLGCRVSSSYSMEHDMVWKVGKVSAWQHLAATGQVLLLHPTS